MFLPLPLHFGVGVEEVGEEGGEGGWEGSEKWGEVLWVLGKVYVSGFTCDTWNSRSYNLSILNLSDSFLTVEGSYLLPSFVQYNFMSSVSIKNIYISTSYYLPF